MLANINDFKVTDLRDLARRYPHTLIFSFLFGGLAFIAPLQAAVKLQPSCASLDAAYEHYSGLLNEGNERPTFIVGVNYLLKDLNDRTFHGQTVYSEAMVRVLHQMIYVRLKKELELRSIPIELRPESYVKFQTIEVYWPQDVDNGLASLMVDVKREAFEAFSQAIFGGSSVSSHEVFSQIDSIYPGFDKVTWVNGIKDYFASPDALRKRLMQHYGVGISGSPNEGHQTARMTQISPTSNTGVMSFRLSDVKDMLTQAAKLRQGDLKSLLDLPDDRKLRLFEVVRRHGSDWTKISNDKEFAEIVTQVLGSGEQKIRTRLALNLTKYMSKIEFLVYLPDEALNTTADFESRLKAIKNPTLLVALDLKGVAARNYLETDRTAPKVVALIDKLEKLFSELKTYDLAHDQPDSLDVLTEIRSTMAEMHTIQVNIFKNTGAYLLSVQKLIEDSAREMGISEFALWRQGDDFILVAGGKHDALALGHSVTRNEELSSKLRFVFEKINPKESNSFKAITVLRTRLGVAMRDVKLLEKVGLALKVHFEYLPPANSSQSPRLVLHPIDPAEAPFLRQNIDMLNSLISDHDLVVADR